MKVKKAVLSVAGGKTQLTYALHYLREFETLAVYHLTDKSHNCGPEIPYTMANVEYGLKYEQPGDEFYASLHSCLAIAEQYTNTATAVS